MLLHFHIRARFTLVAVGFRFDDGYFMEQIWESARTGERSIEPLALQVGESLPAPPWTGPRLRTRAKQRIQSLLRQCPLAAYLGLILCIVVILTASAAVLLAPRADVISVLWLGVLVLFCSTPFAVSLVNWLVTRTVPPCVPPRLELAKGIPGGCRTMVVIPALLADEATVDGLLSQLERHYLTNKERNLFFALLTDFVDSKEESQLTDAALLKRARNGIVTLNQQHAKGMSLFFLFHRSRQWNPGEGVWMGWERKRGKLEELNLLIRGGPSHFSEVAGELSIVRSIRYVIALDVDTCLPPGGARKLVGTIAHPLNRARIDEASRRVVEGYGILQPRINSDPPKGRDTLFGRLYAMHSGGDIYTGAVSEVYQDLFGEGSFMGKGIYEVEAFDLCTAGRFPQNRILSHDLIESCHARSGFVSDITVAENHFSCYLSEVRRRSRWIRGDWQIASWLGARVPGPDGSPIPNPISKLSKWKIFDNLRRSLAAPCFLALLVSIWGLAPGAPALFTEFAIALLVAPGLMPLLSGELRAKTKADTKHPACARLRGIWSLSRRLFASVSLSLILLAYEAATFATAIVQALTRTHITHRKLLEWQTASQCERAEEPSLRAFWKAMWIAPALSAILGAWIASSRPGTLPISLPILLLWLVSPVVAWWISRPLGDTQSARSRSN